MSRQPKYLTPEEQEALYNRTGDPLVSALRGAEKAITAPLALLSSPRESMSALIGALKSPKQTVKAAVKDIKENFSRDPVETVVENLFPMPSTGVAGKLRKIALPEKFALPGELDAVRSAKDFYANELKQRGGMGLRDKVEVANKSIQDNEGWYWDNQSGVVKKQIEPLKWDTSMMETGGPGELYILDEILQDQDMLARILRKGGRRDLPTVAVGAKPKHGSYNPKGNLIIAGMDPWDRMENRGVLNHEFQHYLQQKGGYKDMYRGTNPEAAGSYHEYLINPGEIEARAADIFGRTNKEARKWLTMPAIMHLEDSILAKTPARTPSLADIVEEATEQGMQSAVPGVKPFRPMEQRPLPFRRNYNPGIPESRLYRGIVSEGLPLDKLDDALEGKPRKGYQTTLTTSPDVAGSWSGPEGVIAPFELADNVKIKDFVGKYDNSKWADPGMMDYFGFDEAVQRLGPREVLRARGKRDIGPQATTLMDPDKKFSYVSDIYGLTDPTLLINALRGKK